MILRQQDFLGSYDVFYPLNQDGAKLFGGGTLGLVKLEQDSSGTSRESNISYSAGLQAGLLQELTNTASIEGGYRYLRQGERLDFPSPGQSIATAVVKDILESYECELFLRSPSSMEPHLGSVFRHQ